MHIETRLRHRHFVVLPLCLAVVCATVWAGDSLQGGSLVAGMPAPSGDLQASATLIDVRQGDVTVLGFAGSLRVTMDDGTLAVAALTSPALIRRGDLRLLVPVGYQGQWSLAALPAESTQEWLSQQISMLRPIPTEILREAAAAESAEVAPGPSTLTTASPFATDILSFFQLPSAQERAQTEAQTTDRERLLTLIAHADGQGSASVPLLSQLHDDDLLLVLSLHPAFRDAAWAVEPEGSALAMLHLLSFPVSDTLPQRASSFAFERWEQGMRAILTASEEPAALVEALLRVATPLRERAEQREYPERLQRYAASILGIADAASAALSPEAQEELAAWRAVSLPLPTESSEQHSSVAAAPSQAEAAAMIEQTHQLLLTAGAMLTLRTTITVVDAQSTLVDGVLFAGTESDHAYRFQLNLPAHRVQSIFRDGVPMPFPMDWEGFAAWVKGA